MAIFESARYTLRTIFYSLVPAWIYAGPSTRGGENDDAEGEGFLYTLAAMLDLTIEHTAQAVYARFPSYTSEDNLPLTGADRLLTRGRSEPADAFRERLKRWRYPRGHRVRGNAYAWLEQLQIYWTSPEGERPHVYTIDVSGNRYDRLSDGTETYTPGQAWNWDGASASPNWGRIWTVILPPHGMGQHLTLDDPELWDGLTLDEASEAGFTLDQTGATGADMKTMRDMLRGPHPWSCGGVREEWIVVSLDGSEPVPDGTWATNEGRLDATIAGKGFWPIYSWIPEGSA